MKEETIKERAERIEAETLKRLDDTLKEFTEITKDETEALKASYRLLREWYATSQVFLDKEREALKRVLTDYNIK